MRRSLLPLIVVAGLALVVGPVHATGGILGFSAGANLWFHDSSGTQEFDSSEFDLEDDLGLEKDQNAHIWFEWNHMIPGIPSLRLEQTGLKETGTGEVEFTYGDIAADSRVRSSIELKQTDLTLFWTPIPMPYLDLDIGLTGKHVDGEIALESRDAEQKEAISFSGVLPMLFARVGLDIPGTRVRTEFSIKAIGTGGHSVRDTQFMVAYKWWYTGAMVGYRDISIELDDFDDATVDVSFSGPFAGLFLRF